ncbi:hypothetical protein [Pseudomarimonas salicorniae]|uniref:DUF1269 domain-containing protein n=1 Tax=Pseudomarimonas salicorniae TaxID=2933270 RepID=A0ABT0GI20_9GAMM|nr:hypothetical protein [Lysobacter sp. CAU 1642]MCK7594201.1 hypothetical protein [Lysobacter sp. CAU 1642]
MKIRHVFSLKQIDQAVRTVDLARGAGLDDESISLVARRDISLNAIPDSLKDSATSDFVPAALRGATGGGSIGLLAGLMAAAIPGVGVTLAGAALLGVAGAAVGSWSAALVGAGVPNEVQRLFEERIERGEVLLVLDAEEGTLKQLEPALIAAGAERIDYETPTALA